MGETVGLPVPRPADYTSLVVGGPVLVVDDDTVSRRVLIQALAQADMPHVAVGSGADALEQAQRGAPPVVLLGLLMAPPAGYEGLRALRAPPHARHLPDRRLPAT